MPIVKPTVKFKKLYPEATIPKAKTSEAAGLDLVCLYNTSVLPFTISSRPAIVHTGVAMELPKGYYAEIVLRSSTGRDSKIRLANQVGIIDSDYRGEILLYVENLGHHMEIIKEGTRIAQMLIKKCVSFEVEVTDELSETTRGKSSGSTGK